MAFATDNNLREEIRLLQSAVRNLTYTVQENMQVIKALSESRASSNHGPSVIYTKRHTEHPVGLDAIGYIVFVLFIFAGSLFLLMLMAIMKANDNQALKSYFREYVDKDTCRKRKFQEQLLETKEKLRPPARCNSITSFSHSSGKVGDSEALHYLINSQDNLFSYPGSPTELKSPPFLQNTGEVQLLSPIAAISKCSDLLHLLAKLHHMQNEVAPPVGVSSDSKCNWGAPRSSLQFLSPILLPEPRALGANLSPLKQQNVSVSKITSSGILDGTYEDADSVGECVPAVSNSLGEPMSSEEMTMSSSFENSYYLNSEALCTTSTKSEPILQECSYKSGYCVGDKNTWV